MDNQPRIRGAILRAPAPSLAHGERSYVGRAPIDLPRAMQQHSAYAAALESAGVEVTILPALAERPDSCFTEDAAICLPELSVLTRPGAPSRADEPDRLAPALPADRPVERLSRGRLDGGDVLWAGHTLYVGLSQRTDGEGARALAELVRGHGYRVNTIPIARALHLKTAMTLIGPGLLAVNRMWAPSPPLGFRTVDIGPAEPFGANALLANGRLFAQWSAPVSASRMAAADCAPELLDISEFAKAEAGLTCLSVLVPERA